MKETRDEAFILGRAKIWFEPYILQKNIAHTVWKAIDDTLDIDRFLSVLLEDAPSLFVGSDIAPASHSAGM